MELSDLGSRLRMAREEKSLTLDELQAITRIQKRYLSAIEEGNFEVMPGKFYTRAFIKQYAEAVDLEPEVLFEEYKNEIPIAYEDDLPEQLTRVQSRNSVSRKGSKLIEFFPKILMAIFFIAIIVLVWYLVTNFLISNDKDAVNDEPNTSIDISESDDVPSTDSSADDKGNEGQTDSTDQEKKDDDQSEEDKEQDAQTITVENVAGNTTTYEVSDMSQYEVTVKATDSGEAWIEVTNNSDKQYASKKIANGESETYDFSEDIEAYIRTGRAMDTEIYVNDEKLEFESEATVQNIIIKFNKQQ
ncbi:helix-turn-helix domain-containing protein [Lederbergia galactosidilytica]|uniref:helix-turn-helix domain-containing protein n=1 Tax=Lederbergia galactosidilytica TaxID=217031 RepID=UPI000FFE48F9|nr:RodZ family helix-turn-helix domain-containing protein [Lederbergia galactosidilytica]MBP1913590.1 cytoskeletal protein RodZ [Lederbergia galactosidilytica]